MLHPGQRFSCCWQFDFRNGIVSMKKFIYPFFLLVDMIYSGFPGGTGGEESACQCRRCKRCDFHPRIRKIPWRRKMATHSSILAWKIPWARGAWWAIVYGVTITKSIAHDLFIFSVMISEFISYLGLPHSKITNIISHGFFSFKKKAALRYSSHTIQFTYLNYRI